MEKSGFTFEGSGRLARIDTYTTKAGKDIVTMVLQVEGSYPQLVPIKCFGRLADEARDLTVGDIVEVAGRLGGRDWNGKVYADIVGERIDVVAAASEGAQQEIPRTSASTGQQREEHFQNQDQPARWGSPPPSDDDIPF